VKNPKEVLKLGQEVEVKVLKIEDGGERISLSMKEMEPDPWKGVADKFPRGSEFTGKILRAADFGLFVELEPDVEGLIHVSQLEPGQDMKDEALQPGQEVKGWIREVDSKRHRISLSLREVPDDDPWKTATERFPEGEMAEGTVESIAPFGVFINLAPGLTGLLPNSQTGLPRGTSPARVYTPGQKVEVQVLTIDTRRKRISLGKEGSRIEATKADLQEYRKQVRQEEKQAPGAMAAAFAKLRGDDEG
jgi:small subunit ribosomal protein S1